MYVRMYVRTYVHTTDSCTPFLHWTELTGELSHGVPASVEDLISFATLLFTAEREHMVLFMIKVTTNSGQQGNTQTIKEQTSCTSVNS